MATTSPARTIELTGMTAVKIPDFAVLSPSFPKERISTFADKGMLRRSEENNLVFELVAFQRGDATVCAIKDGRVFALSRLSHLDEDRPRRLEDDRTCWQVVNSNLRMNILLEGSILLLFQRISSVSVPVQNKSFCGE